MARALTSAVECVQRDERTRLSGGLLVLWSVLLASVPVYVFDSGKPQPADMGLAVFLGVATVAGFGRLGPQLRASSTRLVQYALWVVVLNIVWAQIEGFDRTFILSIAFAVFNTVVFVGFICFARAEPERVLSVTGAVVALCLIGQAVLALARPDLSNGARLVLLFNNPNQLAYYCLAGLTIVLLIRTVSRRLPRWLVWGAILSAGFVVYQSYSRSALAGYLLLCTVPLVRRPEFVIAAVLPVAVIGANMDGLLTDDPLWQQRIEQSSSQSVGDYLEDRGIERIIDNPQYIFFGSGEGMHERFHALGLELHSSFAGVLFYYGLPGLVLLLGFLWSIVNRVRMSTRAYLAPMLVYGFFHNGMRFRIFWLALAVVAVINAERDRFEVITREEGDD